MSSVEIVSAVRKVLPDTRRIYNHHEPLQVELRYANAIPFVRKFTDEIQKITGSGHVIPVSSGTAALHISLLAAGIGPGDHVLVPTTSFVATANAVTYTGGIPHFIDTSLFLNPYKLRQFLGNQTTPAPDKKGRIWENGHREPELIKAVIPVYSLGMPGPIDEICQVAKEFGIIVIEDAAAALGSKYDGKHLGTFGDAGIISFNYNKIVTTQGGGVILTDDPFFAAKCHQLSTTARLPHPWLIEHDEIGWNYRMGTINAALGLAQLERFNEILTKKRFIYENYRDAFRNVGSVRFLDPQHNVHSEPNHWLNAIIVDPPLRDETFKALHAEGIGARALPTPLHTLPMYRDHPKYYSGMAESKALFETVICLPSGPGSV
jgi:perosamine synthetase